MRGLRSLIWIIWHPEKAKDVPVWVKVNTSFRTSRAPWMILAGLLLFGLVSNQCWYQAERMYWNKSSKNRKPNCNKNEFQAGTESRTKRIIILTKATACYIALEENTYSKSHFQLHLHLCPGAKWAHRGIYSTSKNLILQLFVINHHMQVKWRLRIDVTLHCNITYRISLYISPHTSCQVVEINWFFNPRDVTAVPT